MKVLIRDATTQDAKKIVARLKGEVVDGTGFYCNRDLVLAAVAKDALSVLTEDQQIAGFLMHDDASMDILEVFPEFRGKGFGRQLALFGMDRIYAGDSLGIDIECQPTTSIPFWKTMGFVPLTPAQYCNNYWHVIHKRFDLPAGTPRKNMAFQFFVWGDEANSFKCSRIAADVDGVLALEERIAARLDPDVVVKISIEGQEIFCNKAKRDEAYPLGIEFLHEFIRIDRITR